MYKPQHRDTPDGIEKREIRHAVQMKSFMIFGIYITDLIHNYNLSVLEFIYKNRRQIGSSVAAHYSTMINITSTFYLLGDFIGEFLLRKMVHEKLNFFEERTKYYFNTIQQSWIEILKNVSLEHVIA